MSEQAHRGGSIGSKFVEEFEAMAALAAYLYICFAAVTLFKSAVLRDVGIHYEIWGIAAVKALVLAKFMLVGPMLYRGTRFLNKPLIWPTLYNSLMFLVMLLILTTQSRCAPRRHQFFKSSAREREHHKQNTFSHQRVGEKIG